MVTLGFVLLIAAAAYLLPYSVEARTGKLHSRRYYLDKKGLILRPWQRVILRDYVLLNFLNSTATLAGALLFLFNYGSGCDALVVLSVVLLVASLCFCGLLVTWPGWAMAADQKARGRRARNRELR